MNSIFEVLEFTKNCCFDVFEALNFDLDDPLQFFMAEIDQNQNSQLLKLISRKIDKFPHCVCSTPQCAQCHTVLAINKKFRQTKATLATLPQILPCKNQSF